MKNTLSLISILLTLIVILIGCTSKSSDKPAAFDGRTPEQIISDFDTELQNGSLVGACQLTDQTSFQSDSGTTIYSAIIQNDIDSIIDDSTYFFVEQNQDGSIKSLTLGGNSSLSLITEVFNLLQLDEAAMSSASSVFEFDNSLPEDFISVSAGGYEFTGIQTPDDPIGWSHIFTVTADEP